MELFSDNFLGSPAHIWFFVQVALGIFHAVLFLQSGHEKVSDPHGTVAWLREHFKETIFEGFVPQLVGIVTLMELLVGAGSLIAVATLVLDGARWPSIIAAGLALLTILQLFIGQRVAKDYPGAAALIPYAILSTVWLGSLALGDT